MFDLFPDSGFIIKILVYIVAILSFLLLFTGYTTHSKKRSALRLAAERKQHRPKVKPSTMITAHTQRHAEQGWYAQVYEQRQAKDKTV